MSFDYGDISQRDIILTSYGYCDIVENYGTTTKFSTPCYSLGVQLKTWEFRTDNVASNKDCYAVL